MITTDIPQSESSKVVDYVRRKIACREIKPGEKLMSERKLSELLKVSRAHVREGLKQLEHAGVVQIFPQSGTVIQEFSKEQLDEMITHAFKASKYDFNSLVYVRVLLEIETMKLCARNRTAEDLKLLEERLQDLEEHYKDEDHVERDFAFHQAIAAGSHNAVLGFLHSIITPDILNYYHKYRFCASPTEIVMEEHREMLTVIRRRDTMAVRDIVLRHLDGLIDFAKTTTNIQYDWGEMR